MNNKGQSLILFVLLLPLIVLFLAFFIDVSLMKFENNRINNVVESNLKIILKNEIKDSNKIDGLFEDNKIKDYSINIDDNSILIKINNKYNGIFGKVLGFKFYNYQISFNGNYISKEIIINR